MPFIPEQMSEEFYTTAMIVIWLTSIFIVCLLAFFLSRLLKHRHELKKARIESGHKAPWKTEATPFLLFRRGVILIFVGLDLGLCVIAGDPEPIVLLPLFLGVGYLTVYLIHAKGIVKLFPDDEARQVGSKPKTAK